MLPAELRRCLEEAQPAPSSCTETPSAVPLSVPAVQTADLMSCGSPAASASAATVDADHAGVGASGAALSGATATQQRLADARWLEAALAPPANGADAGGGQNDAHSSAAQALRCVPLAAASSMGEQVSTSPPPATGHSAVGHALLAAFRAHTARWAAPGIAGQMLLPACIVPQPAASRLLCECLAHQRIEGPLATAAGAPAAAAAAPSSTAALHTRVLADARVLLLGTGADELMGGYSRHRSAQLRGGDAGLRAELAKDVARLWVRNLGRDDRVISDSGREARFPYLDESVMALLRGLPLSCIVDLTLPRGQGTCLLVT